MLNCPRAGSGDGPLTSEAVATRLKFPMAVIRTDSQGIADIAVQVAELTRTSQSSPGKDSFNQEMSTP